MKPKSSIRKITQFLQREATIKALMSVVSKRKNFVDIALAVLSLLSILINYIEVTTTNVTNLHHLSVLCLRKLK